MLIKLPSKINIHDSTLRDGLQREESYIPVPAKLYLIDKLIEAGIKHIEVTNLANPKNLPQFRDADEIIKSLPNVEGVEFTAVTLNQRAAERAAKLKSEGANLHRILLNTSTSEAHHKVNSGRTHEEAWKINEDVIKIGHSAGLKVCGTVTTIFGCPFIGKTDKEVAYDFVARYLDMGADDIEHADHDGEATPDQAYEYFTHIMEKYPNPDLHIFHIHDSRGMGLACYYAAMCAGIQNFESTLGGIGGQPANIMDRVPIPGTGEYYNTARRPGLVCTEDLAGMLDGMNLQGDLDVDKIFALGRMTEKIVGRQLWSFANSAGRLPK